MPKNHYSIKGAPLGRIERQASARDTFAPGRRCHEPGCPTILSRYHRGHYCYAHEPKKTPRNRGIPLKADTPQPPKPQQQEYSRHEVCPGSYSFPYDGSCSGCGCVVALRADGTFRRHGRLRSQHPSTSA